MKIKSASAGKTRGKFLTRCAQFFAGLGLMRMPEYAAAQTPQNAAVQTDPDAKPPYNIIFIINDQRVDKLLEAAGYSLPALSALASRGVTFQQHYISGAMCSPSRASFLSGQPPQVTGVVDQMQFYFVHSLRPEMPNMGSVLKSLGYKTAYFGKFEMDKSILDPKPTVNYSDAAQAYGFDIFGAGGDIGSTPDSGYDNDSFIAGESVRFLREAAAQARTNAQPFFLVASFVNAHDIMYGDGNVPGEPIVQKAVVPSAIPPPPANSIYAKDWSFTLPASLDESLTAPGMPPALAEYKKGWDAWSGTIPTDRKDMWTIFYNYYLNTIADVDREMRQIVDVMDELDLWKNTVVVFTADHGEMGGAHGGLKGKGPFVYEENVHVPLVIAHPAAKAGSTCGALTSHLDLLPTFVGLTGMADARPAAAKALPGRDFSSLIADAENASLTQIRPGILFNYVGPSTVDADFLNRTMVSQFTTANAPKLSEANLDKRGFLAMTFDGRYKYGRYYAPNACNTPRTLDEILKNNDLQLFDLENDPTEVNNLALEPEKNRATILRMNALLNELMAKEVGESECNFLTEAVGPIGG